MSDEQSFLNAIESEPDVRLTRLIYADWLEEHGDLRHELIRIEEEMRTLPIYSDAYWQHKSRRKELRQACDQEWLERMRYGTDYEPVFGDVPDGWKERWRLIREFVERWYGIPVNDVGCEHEITATVEKAAGVSIANSIREWVIFTVDLNYISRQRFKLDFRYRVENQKTNIPFLILHYSTDNHSIGVHKTDLSETDPCVIEYTIQSNCQFQLDLYSPKVSTFALKAVLIDFVADTKKHWRLEYEPPLEFVQALREWSDSYSHFGEYQLFEKTNALAYLYYEPDYQGQPWMLFWYVIRDNGEPQPQLLDIIKSHLPGKIQDYQYPAFDEDIPF